MVGGGHPLELLECVVSPEWAAALAGAGSTSHLQEALARPDLWLEYQLLDKLLYKNANQHRGAQHYQRLQEVRRLLGLLRAQQLSQHVAALHKQLTAAQQRGALPSGSVLMAYGGDQRRVPSHEAAERVLRRLAAACQLIEQLASAVHRASLQLLAQLAHSFFMPLCLTSLAALARIQVLAGQLLLDMVRAYNTIAEVAALLPPSPAAAAGAAGGAAAAAAAAGAAAAPAGTRGLAGAAAQSSGQAAWQPWQEDLPQLLRAQWRQGLPQLERVPCSPGESLADQAAAACQRYNLHWVHPEPAAAVQSAVVLEEGPAVLAQPPRKKQRGQQPSATRAAAAVPVLAVVEDRGVPISREAFEAAAVAAATPAAPAAAVPAPAAAPVQPHPSGPAEPLLLGVVEDSLPEEDGAGNVASLMEGEARGHLYRRVALGLGPPLGQRPQRATRIPLTARPAQPAQPETAAGPSPLAPAAAVEVAVAAAQARAQAQRASAAQVDKQPPSGVSSAGGPNPAAPALKPAFVSLEPQAAQKPALLSLAAPAIKSEPVAPGGAAPMLSATATTAAEAPPMGTAGPSAAAPKQPAPTALAQAAPAPGQPAAAPALGSAGRKRKKPPAAANAAAEQEQQAAAAAAAAPKSWEDWLQPLGGGASGTQAGAQPLGGRGQQPQQQGKRRKGR